MKPLLRITLVLITTLTLPLQLSFGQIQDLSKLANGKLVFNDILWDEKDRLYGYFYLFEVDSDKETTTMEYVILDKNLNRAFNQVFTCLKFEYKMILHTIAGGFEARYSNCNKIGDNIILTRNFKMLDRMHGDIIPAICTVQIFSLKDKSSSKEMVCWEGRLEEITRDHPSLKIKTVTTRAVIQTINSIGDGFFVFDENTAKEFLEKEIRFLTSDSKLKWKYSYNPKGTKKDYFTFGVIEIGQECLYLLLRHMVKGVPIEFKIVALDFKTGKSGYEYLFENSRSQYSRTLHAREINNQLVIVGNYSDYSKKDFQLDENKGYYKVVLDKSGKEVKSVYTNWSDFSELRIDEEGRVEKNFRLRPTKFYFFKDGTISILTEKYKPERGRGIPTHSQAKTSDFVLFNMNEEFKNKSINAIKKELSKTAASDYLFHQYIKDDNGVAFFFGDSEDSREKNWVLGINTIIKGQLTEEKIPISSKNKYFIQPYPAKEGYIMLREYNEEDKYNQVRLEKLNY